ncbi:calcium/proton exchanger [Lepidopterella palustris CBS 459.81]|uniref:Vacuolar calcium ion transporter n=1 Tax=Lepidopterella palustris CBS 459.81 TaxID=1314670 RepID=A0A8E2DWU6_9PEZI|nr:calcium/proton exchanger [Lepidopterella palustris CBS 459.81]
MDNAENEPLIENGVHLPEDQRRRPLSKDYSAYIRWPARFCRSARHSIPKSYTNILFVFVPLGIVSAMLAWASGAVFILNLLAILSLAKQLSFTVAKLSVRLRHLLGGVLKAIFGNGVLIIVSIMALRDNQIRIAQFSMLGSILANALLVVGCCFLAGGIRHEESIFNPSFASTASSMMTVASASLVIPAALFTTQCKPDSSCGDGITVLSRCMSVIMLVLFAVYLNFRLNSHSGQFEAAHQWDDRQEEDEQSSLLFVDIVVLVACILLTAASAFFLIGTIDSISQSPYFNKRFIGFVLLPLVAEGPERIEAVTAAYNNNMDRALDFAIGRSMQIALFATPFLVLLGWAMRISEPMTLHFQSFETIAFFLSVLLVNDLIGDGKSNYLEGAMCLATYAIIALAFQFLPQ